MPLTEVSNALLITYIATEYSIASSSKNGFSLYAFVTSRSNQIVLAVVILINLIDRLVGAALILNQVFETLLHVPKIVLAAVLYVAVLYVDCLRHVNVTDGKKPSLFLSSGSLTPQRFLTRVGMEFLKLLPLYPFLAVLISCGFMFVISACEHLHISPEWLNWPIYYGTLYGPFSLVYFKVKSKIVEEESYFLPAHTTTVLPFDFFESIAGSTSSTPPSSLSSITGQRVNHVRDLRLANLSKR